MENLQYSPTFPGLESASAPEGILQSAVDRGNVVPELQDLSYNPQESIESAQIL